MKMNFIDRLVGAVNPDAGVRRAFKREQLEAARSASYDAAASGRLQSQWTLQNQSAEMTDRYDRDIVRARARDLERNSDALNSVTRAYRRNVVGAGLQVRITTGDEELNQTLQKAWARWCKRRNCDVTGMQDFMQIVRMCIQRKLVDGGILIVKRYTNQGFIPLQLQILETDEIDTTQITPMAKGNRVVGGIEYNRWNRPQGYWIRQWDIDGYTQMDPVYVDAKDVIFYFTKRRPSQLREISDLAPLLTRIKDLNEFITAVTLKEKIAACLAVFIKRVTGGKLDFGRSGVKAEDGTVQYEDKRIVPGMIMEMNPGDEAQMLNPSGQGADATNFLKAVQRMISAACGLSYEATSRDMSDTNYSSARQSMIEDDLTYDEEKETLFGLFLDEVYESFVISCYLRGLFAAPDFWEQKEKYLSHEWVTKPKRWIDPAKEANANATALKTGQKTFQQICAESGRDWKQVVDEMAEAQHYALAQGVNLMGMIQGKEGVTAADMEDDDGKGRDKKGETA